ncbi:deoxyribonuclease ii [Culex quinquefasciatus]|uniref:Deoxyribonuclease ii n=1 Tax=Culex quinquefasciatus TaxID=7176 RepID=B0XH46_CULQU|nr:deoxyribonuclease ii [Culex quinquefasciatus]|eukprot:XP_001868968.1 deoxyribonuclease ii [Culex quinquefasciatus]
MGPVRRACQRCCTTKNLQQGKGQTKGVEATAGVCGFWSIYKVPNTPSKLGRMSWQSFRFINFGTDQTSSIGLLLNELHVSSYHIPDGER